MQSPIRVLHVDDNPLDRDLVIHTLEKEHGGFQISTASSRAEFEKRLEAEPFDIVLSDFNILGFTGLQVLDAVHEKKPDVPVIIVTGTGSEEVAVQALKRGADDYVLKTPYHIQRLPQTIYAALEKKRLREDSKRAQEALRESEERHRLIFENSGEAILFTQPDGTIYSANPEACRIFGRSEDEIRKIGRAGIVDTNDSRLQAALEERRRTGQFKGELNLLRKDGTIFFGEVSTAVFKDSNGNERTSMTIRDITERKRAEESLRRSQQLLEKTFAALDQAVFVIDPATRTILTANPAVEHIFGYRLDEVIGRSTESLHLDQERFAEFGRLLFPVLDTHGIFHMAYQMRRKDGSVFFSENTVTKIRNEAGQRTAVVSVVRDITERKQAEEKIAHQANLLANVNDAVLASDEKFVLTAWNHAAERIYGWTAEEVIGKSGTEILQTEFLTMSRPEAIKQLIESGEYLAEVINSRKDGTKIYIETRTTALLDTNGKTIGYVSINRDITERKWVEKALRESEEKFRNLFNNAEVGMFRTRLDGSEMLDMNEKHLKIFGLTRAEMQGSASVIRWADAREREEMVRQLEAEGNVTDFECRMLNKQGEVRRCLTSLRLYRDQGILEGSILDITERKLAEEELYHSRQQLRALAHHLQTVRENERTLIAREIHDELGQSLTALKMDLVWLTKRLPPEATALHQKAQGMTTMINESLQLMRRIASDLRPGLLDDLGLIAAMEWQASEFTKRSEVTCRLNLPQELTLDRDRTTAVFRIFQETLTNITRHAQAKQVEVWLEADESEIRLTVKDDGVGITADQINDPKSLGLIGVRERVVYFNGSVSIESRDGTTVTVRIPK